MKIKVLHRSDDVYSAQGSGITPCFRNPDPQLHPFEKAREYQRALVAVKMGKMFAKPFIKALEGHLDAVKCISVARHPGAPLLSGSCDGELRLWNLQRLTCDSIVPRAHEGFVRGVVVTQQEDRAFSCGDDKTIKLWSVNPDETHLGIEPQSTYHCASIPNSVDSHWQKPLFVSVGDTVDVWDQNRSTPLNSFEWGCDRVITARFNPAEPALIASTAVDRSIGLYDLRGNSAIRKVILKMRSNAVCWHPMQPHKFVVANEDCNLYEFDMRSLSAALARYQGHTMAVLDARYNPSGTQIVSASYDMSIRLWVQDQMQSQDVYHAKRMQRVLCCDFTPDSRFVLTGSEDANIRLWKAKSDAKLGTLNNRERRAVAYREALKDKYGHLPEIRSISRRKHLPKLIKSLTDKRKIMRQARARKEENRRKHAKPGAVPVVPAKKKVIVKEKE